MVELVTVTVPELGDAAAAPRAAELPLMVELATVSVPTLAMPPPPGPSCR